MSRFLMVANWKMNGSLALIDGYKGILDSIDSSLDLVICPPSLYASFALDAVCNKNNVYVGIQSIYGSEDGPFTGFVCSRMVKDIGCSHVVIGHSETRKLQNLSLGDLKKCVTSALRHNLSVIYCLGEVSVNDDIDSFASEIEYIFGDIELSNDADIVIAYEPLWSIGSGVIPDLAHISSIASVLHSRFSIASGFPCRVIYGGSVGVSNVLDISRLEFIDGVMLGGSSLNVDNVRKMVLTLT